MVAWSASKPSSLGSSLSWRSCEEVASIEPSSSLRGTAGSRHIGRPMPTTSSAPEDSATTRTPWRSARAPNTGASTAVRLPGLTSIVRHTLGSDAVRTVPQPPVPASEHPSFSFGSISADDASFAAPPPPIAHVADESSVLGAPLTIDADASSYDGEFNLAQNETPEAALLHLLLERGQLLLVDEDAEFTRFLEIRHGREEGRGIGTLVLLGRHVGQRGHGQRAAQTVA